MDKEILELLKSMQADVNSMKTDVNSMKTDINLMKTDINSMKLDINSMKTDIKDLKKGQNKLEKGQEEIKALVTDLDPKNATKHTEILLKIESVSKDVKFVKHKLHETEEDVFDIKDHLKIVK